MKNNIFDVVIIGAGPAGITAAIYLTRANLNCAIIEKETPGGQINKTSIVENYPGYISIKGPKLVEKLTNQLNNLEIKQIKAEVVAIKNKKNSKTIILKDNTKIETKEIILALGRKPKKLLDQKSSKKGISYSSLDTGHLYKKKDVSIVGSGNSALEESLYLSEICKSVTILCRSDKLKGDSILIKQIKKRENINVLYNTTVEDFIEEKGVLTSLKIKENEEEKIFKTKACFIFIGYEPSTDFLKKLDILDENGYIIVDPEYRTKISGIYAAGDVVAKPAFQIVTATSDGAIAALSAIKDIKEV